MLKSSRSTPAFNHPNLRPPLRLPNNNNNNNNNNNTNTDHHNQANLHSGGVSSVQHQSSFSHPSHAVVSSSSSSSSGRGSGSNSGSSSASGVRMPLLRSQSVLDTRTQFQFKKAYSAVPFMAIPGVSSELIIMKKTASMANFAALQRFTQKSFSASGQAATGYGSTQPASFRDSFSGSSSTVTTPLNAAVQIDKSLTPTSSSASFDEHFATLTDLSSVGPDPFLDESSLTLSLMLAVLSAVLASLQVGYNSSVINAPALVIQADLSITTLAWSFAVAVFAIGGLIGSYVGGRLADVVGRKNFLIANNVLFISGGLMEALASGASSLILARLVLGVGCGAATVVVPLYLGEIAPADLRGTLGTMNQFALVIGILLACLLGKPLGGTDNWRYLLGLVIVPALLQIIMSPVLLESPLWLVYQNTPKSMSSAEEVLSTLRGVEDVSFDIGMMEAARDSERSASGGGGLKLWGTLLGPSNRRALIIALSLQLAQQFSGINAVFYYSTSFFASAGIPDPWLGSALACAVNVLATALALKLMDSAGRRVLLLISSAGMAVSALLLTFALREIMNGNSTILLGYGCVGTVLLFVTFFELGLGPIPWLIGAEIFPPQVRATAMTLSSGVNWVTNAMVGVSFPFVSTSLGYMSFVPFAVVCVGTLVFTLRWVPETRGKSIEQIQKELGVVKVRRRLPKDSSLSGSFDSLEEEESEYEDEAADEDDDGTGWQGGHGMEGGADHHECNTIVEDQHETTAEQQGITAFMSTGLADETPQQHIDVNSEQQNTRVKFAVN